MRPRPYSDCSYFEIEAAAKANGKSISKLQVILRELEYRSSEFNDGAGASTALLARVIALQITRLGGTPGGWQPDLRVPDEAQARAARSKDSEPAGRTHTAAGPNGMASLSSDELQLRELTVRVERAERKVEELQNSLKMAQQAAKRVRTSPKSPVEDQYARLGLVPECPDFVFEAAMRELRKKHHPDALPHLLHSERLAAQEVFKSFEVVFRQIKKMRAAKST